MQCIMDGLASISVIIAALSFVFGVYAWKREYVGKRRIELAQSVLAMFYEADDAIIAIRNEGGFEGEGKTRKQNEGETPQMSKILDQDYVVFERYKTREKLFAEIRSNKYQFMAVFGKEYGEPFDELNKAVKKILLAGRALRRYHLQMERGTISESAQEKLSELTREQESLICYAEDKDDQIVPVVNKAIEQIEKVVERETENLRGWLSKLMG